MLLALGVMALAFVSLPVARFEESTNTVLEDADGGLLSARITSDGQWRFPDCDSVPYKLSQCIRYYEDEFFPYHPGSILFLFQKPFFATSGREGL